MSRTDAPQQPIIDVFLKHRQEGVLPTNEILFKPSGMRGVVLGLAELGVSCYLITGWYRWPEPEDGNMDLVEDLAADYSIPQEFRDDVRAATRWALDRIDNGLGPQHIYVGSEFSITLELHRAVTEAWRALPGPTWPLPFDEGTTNDEPR